MKKRMTLLCLVLCLLLPVLAQAEAVDPDRAASLTLHFADGGTPLAGACFSAYRVAAINEHGAYALLPGWDVGDADLNRTESAAQWMALAQLLSAQTEEATDAAVTDQQGLAVMEDLEPGLYLVTGLPLEVGVVAYEFAPMMISLPGKTDGKWQYDVYADVKFSKGDVIRDVRVFKYWSNDGNGSGRPGSIMAALYCDGQLYTTVELTAEKSWSHTFENLSAAHEWTVSELNVPNGYKPTYGEAEGALTITNTRIDTPTPPPDIPQTGLVWWPVPLLAVLGIALVLTGLVLRRKWGSENE